MATYPAHGSLNYDAPLQAYIDEGDADNAAALAAAVATLETDKADLASPVFTGDPQAPTAALGDDDTTIATTEFVQNELSALGMQASFTHVVKTVDESVVNSTTLQDDNELFFAVDANSVYVVDLTLFVEAVGEPDGEFKMALSFPSGTYSGMVANRDQGSTDVPVFVRNAVSNTVAHVAKFTTDLEPFAYRFRVATAGTGGTCILRWAQNIDHPTPATVKAGSWLEVRKAA